MAQHTLTLDNSRRFRILIIGAGGNGSAIFLGLPYLHQAMRAWGHSGLDVTLMDADTVSATNCIRQPFAQSDLGQNKATVLVSRTNLFWGLDWKSAQQHFTAKALDDGQGFDRYTYDLIIGCVDSKSSRKAIYQAVTLKRAKVGYWLDLGNSASHGQFILGQPANAINKTNRLPTAAELYPEIIDTTTAEDNLPSCSAIEALERQEPFINQTLAMQALAMLTQLMRYGKTSYHGGFFNAKTGTTQPIQVPTTAPTKARRKK